jgi:7-keto-8-aminopelargonate synthetase-like enzyme
MMRGGAEGVSRSTWYRRGNRISDKLSNLTPGKSSNLLNLKSQNFLDLSRAEAFVRELQAELVEVARCQAVTAAIIGEMTAQST